MRKLAGSGLAVALFGLALGLAPTGCSDDAGGNEEGVMEKTEGGTGITPKDSPNAPEDYYKKARQTRRR